MEITPIPCLKDNYAYLLHDPATRRAAIVDPSETAPVLDALERCGAELVAILCTHHHHDHVGGVPGLLERFGTGLGVWGHASDRERIPGLSRPVVAGDRVELGAMRATVLEIPAHTLGAVAYVFDTGEVFTGDTLFVAGCGRLFEGTPAMMHRALNETLGALPDDARVYPGHEYALSNLRFASVVEPGNPAVRARLDGVAARRERGESCVPSTMAQERATNPFMRASHAEVRAFARARGADDADPVAVLGAVRAAKDVF